MSKEKYQEALDELYDDAINGEPLYVKQKHIVAKKSIGQKMNKRTQATSISTKVRQQVMARDKNHCIFCGSHQMLTIAHYISRANGGKGIKENLVLLCMACHMKLDQSSERKKLLQIVKNHLQSNYGDFDESSLKYKKGE